MKLQRRFFFLLAATAALLSISSTASAGFVVTATWNFGGASTTSGVVVNPFPVNVITAGNATGGTVYSDFPSAPGDYAGASGGNNFGGDLKGNSDAVSQTYGFSITTGGAPLQTVTITGFDFGLIDRNWASNYVVEYNVDNQGWNGFGSGSTTGQNKWIYKNHSPTSPVININGGQSVAFQMVFTPILPLSNGDKYIRVDDVKITMNAVPEPSTGALVGVVACAAGSFFRRRKA
jgi:hypothetical protein